MRYKVQTLINKIPVDAIVDSLMMDNGTWWNDRLIQAPFWEEEANLIINIPTSQSQGKDKMIWQLTTNGAFSVKSVYHHALLMNKSHKRDSSKGYAIDPMWKQMWKIQVPNKVKNFLWRSSTNSLPTMANLKLRKVTPNGLCPICSYEEETVIYLVWNCPTSLDVWAKTKCHKWPSRMKDMAHLFNNMLSVLNHANMELSCVIMRNLWLRKNNVVFNHSFPSPFKILPTGHCQR